MSPTHRKRSLSAGTRPRFLLRAIGPALKAHGVPNTLEDPATELRDINGALMVANDNWKESQESEIIATGIAPTDDRESAILRLLPGGNYTAIVRGKDGSAGIGLVEACRLNVPSRAACLLRVCPPRRLPQPPT